MKISIYLFLIIVILGSVAVAQDKKDKIEIGVQSTSLTLFNPDFPFDETRPGVGGRVTYNFNRWMAAEAEINFFPHKKRSFTDDSDSVQAQFGVKLGKRFEKFGLFAKVRPGFLSVDDVFSVQPGASTVIDDMVLLDAKIERTNYFTIDAGGVLELYPDRRSVVRFEAGDTAIRYPTFFDFDFSGTTTSVKFIRSAKFTHNFQFTAGVAFRLGDFPAEEADVKTSVDGPGRIPRFEVGVQFTSMSVAPVTTARQCPACVSSDLTHTEPGFGGRFTVNLNEKIALEAEGNFFTREIRDLPNPSGFMFQAQFGPKIGKRYEKWGWFGKVRPGFIGFTKVNKLVDTFFQIRNLNIPALVGVFAVGKTVYPSVDIGGVVEIYISRRWMARFDIGDTIIRYGELPVEAFSARNPIFRRPPEIHQNLQISSGIGFRF